MGLVRSRLERHTVTLSVEEPMEKWGEITQGFQYSSETCFLYNIEFSLYIKFGILEVVFFFISCLQFVSLFTITSYPLSLQLQLMCKLVYLFISTSSLSPPNFNKCTSYWDLVHSTLEKLIEEINRRRVWKL